MIHKKNVTSLALFFMVPLSAVETGTITPRTSTSSTTSATVPVKSSSPVNSKKAVLLKAIAAQKADSKDTAKTNTSPKADTPLKKPDISEEELSRIIKEKNAKEDEKKNESALYQGSPKPGISSSASSMSSVKKPIPSQREIQQSHQLQRSRQISTQKNSLKKELDESQKSYTSMHEAVIAQQSLVHDLKRDQSSLADDAQKTLEKLNLNLDDIRRKQEKVKKDLKDLELEEQKMKKGGQPLLEKSKPVRESSSEVLSTPDIAASATAPEEKAESQENTLSTPVLAASPEGTPPIDTQRIPQSLEQSIENRQPKGKPNYFELIKMAATATALRVKSGINAVYNWWYKKQDGDESAPESAALEE